MTSQLPPPKAILFDIGGVCVVSPFQAILDYEHENNIPVGWVNFAIQKGPQNGAWQLIERGECELNDDWFRAFKAQLSIPKHWKEYCIKAAVKSCAEKGLSTNSEAVVGHEQAPPVPEIDAKKLFWRMMRMSREPDPWMYPALKTLKESGRFVLGALSNTIAFPTGIKDDEGALFKKGLVHKPHPNPYANDPTDIADVFDVFISSAHVGLRKPDPKAYAMAVQEMSRVAVMRGMGEVRVEEVLFLDDIGVNLKWAKICGLRTIKVDLGKTREAVRELERQVGLGLLGENEKARL
ncbi:HAD-like protein [Lindgomyces ingoldianus]|uniref:HAD-like protein n=1 Tax=Lindgomyces ingoldianus TaxID=673940 RepID=A0ACB6QT29_9PLEO|nr:HAD-like protein [Lindgomyces ingoldianus]KAF2470144.1 HAD-like protein [Lindgomyces ingoldianus]